MSPRTSPEARTARALRVVRAADLWRGVGLGLALVWAVVLALVVTFWLRVTFFPRPGDEVSGTTQFVLAPIALVSAALFCWTLVSLWSLWFRRERGWDVVVVLGAFATAGAAFLVLPGEFLDGVQERLGPRVLALAGMGVFSVLVGLLGQRSWRTAAVALDGLRDPYAADEDGLEVEMWAREDAEDDLRR